MILYYVDIFKALQPIKRMQTCFPSNLPLKCDGNSFNFSIKVSSSTRAHCCKVKCVLLE